jgi:hypothetical protein
MKLPFGVLQRLQIDVKDEEKKKQFKLEVNDTSVNNGNNGENIKFW